MPLVIRCEHCQASLKLPEQYIGQTVKCPSCLREFVAREELESRPQPPPRREEQPADEPRGDEPGVRGQPGRERPRPRRADENDEDYQRPSRRRRYDDDYGRRGEPHRGSSIQTMGILSIVFAFCCQPVGVILGIIALTMAGSDLPKMERGYMDPSGESMTRTGKTCAIVGLILSVILFVLGCLFRVGAAGMNNR
jgi:hypothetical protein